MARGRYYSRKKSSDIPFERRFFYLREGQPIPPGLKIVHKCVSQIECVHYSGREAFQRIKIDTERLGYNGLIDSRYESCRSWSSIRGLPVQIVPEANADIYTEKEWEKDDFSPMLYSRQVDKERNPIWFVFQLITGFSLFFFFLLPILSAIF